MRKTVNLWVPETFVVQLELLAAASDLIASAGPGAGRRGSVSALVTMLGRGAAELGVDQVAAYLRPLQDALAASDAEALRLIAEREATRRVVTPN